MKKLPWLENVRNWRIWKKYSVSEWFVVGLGVITLFYLLINLFTTFDDNTPPPFVDQKITIKERRLFEETIAGTLDSTVERGGDVVVLTNGDEFVNDFLNEVKNAKESIYITNYIWDNGEFGKMLFEALIPKAEEGRRRSGGKNSS
jgi:hypothetical protein